MAVKKTKKTTRTTKKAATARPRATAAPARPRPAPRVRNTVAARSTNRTANRFAVDYTLPAGDLRDFLDKQLAQVKRQGLALRKLLGYSRRNLLVDLREMLERPAADAAAFAAEGTPVTDRHLELAALYLEELEAAGVDALLEGAATEVIGEDAAQAMAQVARCRNRLAERAKACGIPVQLFEIRRAMGSPAALHARASQVLDAAAAVLEQFDNPRRAKELWAELHAAVERLGQVAGERLHAKLARAEQNERLRLLFASLYPYMLWLSQWGRAVFADDLDGLRRWRLDKTFPGSANQDATPEAQIAAATGDAGAVPAGID